jgi:hypothetical protein
MRFDTYEGERDLAELARRLFKIGEGRKTARDEATRRAEAAILEANPHLRDLRRVAEGTLIVVPELAGLKPNEQDRAVYGLEGELPAQLRQAVDSARAVLDAAAEREVREANETAGLVRSRELKELARNIPAVNERLAGVAEETRRRLREAEAVRGTHKRALAQLVEDLDELK